MPAADPRGSSISNGVIHGLTLIACCICSAAEATVNSSTGNVWKIEQQRVIELETSKGGDDLDRVPGKPERHPEVNQFRVPHGKHHVASAHGLGARQYRVGGHAREPFIDEVGIGVPAAQHSRIGGGGVSVRRLHEHQ